jgi:hypothetical protein
MACPLSQLLHPRRGAQRAGGAGRLRHGRPLLNDSCHTTPIKPRSTSLPRSYPNQGLNSAKLYIQVMW